MVTTPQRGRIMTHSLIVGRVTLPAAAGAVTALTASAVGGRRRGDGGGRRECCAHPADHPADVRARRASRTPPHPGTLNGVVERQERRAPHHARTHERGRTSWCRLRRGRKTLTDRSSTMDDETAVLAVLVPPQLARFRQVCQVDGAIEPRFDGYTKHVLLTADRAFLFPRNHTLVTQLERECDVYAAVGHPFVPRLLGRWHDPGISPYPFFAVTRLAGVAPGRAPSEHLPALAAQLGAALAACHETRLDDVPPRLWANAWQEPPAAPPTALDCYSPLRA